MFKIIKCCEQAIIALPKKDLDVGTQVTQIRVQSVDHLFYKLTLNSYPQELSLALINSLHSLALTAVPHLTDTRGWPQDSSPQQH